MSDIVGSGKKPHRRGWIDYARGFVIIYVVYRHALSGLLNSGIPIKNAIYLVQESSMPVFFIVSGIFIHSSALKRGLRAFVRLKLETLMYPYFIWASIHLTIQIIFSHYSNTGKDFHYFFYLFTYPRAIDQFWYLYALFAAMMIFATLNFKIFHFKPMPNILIAIALYLLSYIINTNQFSVNDILFYYLFLVFGFLMADSLLPVDGNFFKGKWLIYLLPVFVLFQIVWRMRYPNVHLLVDLDFTGFLMFLPITIIGALLIFLICYKLDEWGKLKALRYIGSHSLYIYIMHLIFTGALRLVLMKFFPGLPSMVMLVIIMVGGILIPIGLYQVLIRLKLQIFFEPPLFFKRIHFSGSRPQ